MASLMRMPFGAVAAFALIAVTLVASQLSMPGFLGLSITCFVITTLAPFVNGLRRGFNAGEALYPFIVYYAVAMGVRGIALLVPEDSPYLAAIQDPRSATFQGLMGWMFFLSAIGLAALHLGYESAAGVWAGERLGRWLGRKIWRPARTSTVTAAFLAVGFVGATLYARSFGGFRAAATQDLVFVATEGTLGNFWKLVLMEFAVVGFHVLLLGELLRGGRKMRWGRVVPVGALVTSLYLVTSSKFLLLRILLPPMLFFHLLRRRISIAHLAVFFAVFGALFPVFYAHRLLGSGDWGAILSQVRDVPHDSWFDAIPLLGRAYDADSFVRVLHDTGRTVPFRFGGSFLDIFIFFIPRALWPAKPPSYGLEFADQYFGDVNLGGLSFVSPSLPGELYLNFHVAGILAGMFALGVLFRATWRAAVTGGVPGALLYGYFYLFAIHLVEGSIASQVEMLLMSVAPAWLALRALGAGGTRRAGVRELATASMAGRAGGPAG